MKRVLHSMILFVIALVFCVGMAMAYLKSKPPGHFNDQTDASLRSFLGIRSFRAHYKPPAGHKYFVCRTLKFENRKLIGQGGGTNGEIDERGFSVEFLWGNVNGKCRTSLNDEGGRGISDDEFWSNLTFAFSSVGEMGSVGRFESYDILGFAQSVEETSGKNEQIAHRYFEEALDKKKFVGALAIRTFANREEMEKAH